MGLKRLFWGLAIEEAVKKESERQLAKVKVAGKKKGLDLKWYPPENFHITLCFLGSVEEEVIDSMVSEVRHIATWHEPFSLKLKGVGGFPEAERARVVYIGAQAKTALMNLQKDLTDALAQSFELDRKDFVPHMTVARLKNRHNLKDILSPLERRDFGKAFARELVLFESLLGGAFPIYEPVLKIALGRNLQKNVEDQDQDGIEQ